ncbi:hypothetical protein Tco_0551832 [Tanacetum coccineum]
MRTCFDESNGNVLERFYTSAGKSSKEILLKIESTESRILKDGGEVLKITSLLTSKDKGTSLSLKFKNYYTYHKEKSRNEVYELKTKDVA